MTSNAQFAAESREGRFERQESKFRGRDVEPVAGRYHLYVSLACPWAHRAVIVRRLKGLEDAIGLTVVDPIREEKTGWRFNADYPDPLHGWSFLSEAYALTDPSFRGRVTVPVLWDTETGTIVNNESADVIEMLNADFDPVAANPGLDLYPEALRAEMDPLMQRIYDTLNNGVYRSGFASTQEAYEEAVVPLFETLDMLEERLADRPYLMGTEPTLADWRLFTTLVRFDAVYHGHFKCNIRRIVDYPNLQRLLRDLYRTGGIAETVDFDQIKRHYYMTHEQLNPSRIVPVGPALDL
ncbi:MAG: glutathione S-transferase family protein [Solirubrobacteraceae bacterium]